MIDLSLIAGQLSIRITWKRPASIKAPAPPQSTAFPMRLTTPVGFGRRTVRTHNEHEAT